MKQEKHTAELLRDFYRVIIERPELSGVDTSGAFEDVPELMRISRALHRCDENACNGFTDWRGRWDEVATKRNEQRAENLERKAQAIADKYKAHAYHQGDPRGCSLYILPWIPKRGENVQYTNGVAIY